MSSIRWRAGTLGMLVVMLGPAAAVAEAEESSGDVPPGYMLVGGDMLFPIPAVASLSVPEPQLWPAGIVPYEFAPQITDEQQAQFRRAMAEWVAVADVMFIPRDGEDVHIHIRPGEYDDVSNATVGPGFGQTYVNVGTNHWTAKWTLVHELGHTLGTKHEHERSDRLDYIIPRLENVDPEFAGNFNTEDDAEIFGPYDFDSIMHYGPCNFSICDSCWDDVANCATIEVHPDYADEYAGVIGQRDHLSDGDIAGMVHNYGLPNSVFVDVTYSGDDETGEFLTPFTEFDPALEAVPSGGKVWLHGGSYEAVQTIDQAVHLRAFSGSATLGG